MRQVSTPYTPLDTAGEPRKGIHLVQMKKTHRQWRPGDIAGFPEEKAAAFVKSSSAVYVEPDKDEVTTPDKARREAEKREAAKAAGAAK